MAGRSLIALLALAGCGAPPSSPQEPPANRARPAPAAVRLSGLPPAFRGRWALVPADCEPGRADAKGLMVVEARRLSFYESRAVPLAVAASGPDRLTARLRYAGEGQEWTQDAVLTLSDGGRTLVRDEKGADTGVLRYRRCA